MSNVIGIVFCDEQIEENRIESNPSGLSTSVGGKRRTLVETSNHQHSKKIKTDQIECVKMTDSSHQQKKSPFSANIISGPNGVSKNTSPLTNSKPSSAKKLIIKNFGKS